MQRGTFSAVVRRVPVVPFSLNVPVPGRVKRLAADLEPDLYRFDRVRQRHTLIVKRFGERTPAEYATLESRVRRTLSGAPAFEARVAGIDAFEQPVWGPGPVVYLGIESPGLIALHDRLCAAFSTVEEIEGENYTPHVTLARGGSPEMARRLCERGIDPVTWTVEDLALWDGTHKEVVSRVSLPA